MSVNPDAICGNCGCRRTSHVDNECPQESFQFTDTPDRDVLLQWLDHRPLIYQQLVQQWRKESGHE